MPAVAFAPPVLGPNPVSPALVARRPAFASLAWLWARFVRDESATLARLVENPLLWRGAADRAVYVLDGAVERVVHQLELEHVDREALTVFEAVRRDAAALKAAILASR